VNRDFRIAVLLAAPRRRGLSTYDWTSKRGYPPSLRRNLQNQVEIYKKASDAQHALKVIVYFTAEEYQKVVALLKELKLDTDKSIILIDARADNKPSASKADDSNGDE